MGTEKTSELSYVVLRLAESGQLAQLTRLILDLEAIMEKYKRLEEATKNYIYSTNSMGKLGSPESQLYHYEKLLEVLKELGQG